MPHPQAFEEFFDTSDFRLAVKAFYSLAESIPQPAWSFGADGRCDYVNRRWLEYTGAFLNDVIHHDWSELIHSSDLDRALSSWKAAAQQRAPFEVKCRLRAEGGEYLCFLMRAVPLVDGDVVVRWFATFTETGDQEQRSEKLLRNLADTNADLNACNEELEEHVALRTRELQETIAQLEAFAYSLAHDMRAPCRALTNFSQILLRDYAGNLPEEPRDFLRRIAREAKRLDSFIQDLLVYSRVAHDRMPLDEVNVEQVLADVIVSTPNFQPPLAYLSIHFPLRPVLANETLLAQCLTNLLMNACKFVKDGETPQVHIFDETRDGMVRIYIEDNGIGISEDNQNRIFSLFERLNHENEFPGTGVGLSIVRKAVERMGGKVGVVSEPEKGSRFWLELKAVSANV